MRFVDVAIPRSSPDVLTYRLPADLEGAAAVGLRVRVPLRRQEKTAVITALREKCDLEASSVRAVVEILDSRPLMPPHVFEVAEFISHYYRCPLGTTLAAVLPSGLLRSDTETIEMTPDAVGLDLSLLTRSEAAVFKLLRERKKMPLASLLARSALSRGEVKRLEERRLLRVLRSRRDRPRQREVAAIALVEGELEEMLQTCGRATQQKNVLRWLDGREGPVLESEVRAEVGCSHGVLKALEKRNFIRIFRQAAAGRPLWSLGTKDCRHSLTREQKAVLDLVVGALDARRFEPVLLEGITGSGKTEVYLRCLEEVLERGRDGLVLVPEIGLTPATVGAVEARFGAKVAVLHSSQAEGERWAEWQRIRRREARIVVGPRSALFAPLEGLGFIVVDEEQDGAYKQQERPRYNARDLSLLLGRSLQIPVLLCSATPSTEAAHLVERGLAQRLRLTRRPGVSRLPEVELVDLRAERPEPGEQGRSLFSGTLKEAMTETLEQGRQIILLMQRRGWAPSLLCRECGHSLECRACSVSLVVHRRPPELRCHYCGYRSPIPRKCPGCGGVLLDAVGAGTEKVAHLLHRHFPGVPAGVLDRDTVRRRQGLEETLGAFSRSETKILVGTQMVAKGHHFPNVTLTGVISADALLNLPDFRAGERTFQLLTQVAGRSGRGEIPGRVIIQTYYPDHPAVLHAASHDVSAFLEEELRFRRAFQYPPVYRMALIRFESASIDAVQEAAAEAAACLNPQPGVLRLRGPAPAPMERLRERWRWQLLLSAVGRAPIWEALERIEGLKVPGNVMRIIDVDPLSTL